MMRSMLKLEGRVASDAADALAAAVCHALRGRVKSSVAQAAVKLAASRG
jgi:Holliday junction resolvasome RuvABC endonuclease subunit